MIATRYVRAVTGYLRDEYGIDRVDVNAGGSHPSLTFSYAGQPHKLTIQNPTNDRGGAVRLKQQDIRRLLGDPPPRSAAPEKRTLAEMTQTLEARASSAPFESIKPPSEALSRTFPCHISLTLSASSPNPRLRIGIPPDLYAAFGHTGGLEFRRLSEDEYEVLPKPTLRRPTFTLKHGEYSSVSERAVQPPLPPERRFGSSMAEAVLVDGHIMLRLLERRPVKRMKTGPRYLPKTSSGAQWVEPPNPVSLEAEMRAAIATIRRVETETPYRLIRVKDTATGHWAFSAPRIE